MKGTRRGVGLRLQGLCGGGGGFERARGGGGGERRFRVKCSGHRRRQRRCVLRARQHPLRCRPGHGHKHRDRDMVDATTEVA